MRGAPRLSLHPCSPPPTVMFRCTRDAVVLAVLRGYLEALCARTGPSGMHSAAMKYAKGDELPTLFDAVAALRGAYADRGYGPLPVALMEEVQCLAAAGASAAGYFLQVCWRHHRPCGRRGVQTAQGHDCRAVCAWIGSQAAFFPAAGRDRQAPWASCPRD